MEGAGSHRWSEVGALLAGSPPGPPSSGLPRTDSLDCRLLAPSSETILQPLTSLCPGERRARRARCRWQSWGKLASRKAPVVSGGSREHPQQPPVHSLRLRPCCCKAIHYAEAPGHTGLGGGGPCSWELAPWSLQGHTCPENAGVDSDTLQPTRAVSAAGCPGCSSSLIRQVPAHSPEREEDLLRGEHAVTEPAQQPGVLAAQTEQGHGASAIPGARRPPGCIPVAALLHQRRQACLQGGGKWQARKIHTCP
ncbi:hypothetical protein HJG60_009594 [Phyllostomus discolor]|uniref:Uncharacterized protein n=1 Tax=Phyllostomus discolor TaxID=89673 RepID=A0A833YC54_9CHIR|nr:hypothetical protein HJG60_009594 [Phyllostomus discolor]